MLKGAVSTLPQPRGRALCQREEGRNGVDGQDHFVPASTGQQGEQQAQCAPRTALPLAPGQVSWDAKELPDNLCFSRAL